MNIVIFAAWVMLVAVVAGSRFCGRRAYGSAIAIADHLQRLGGRARDRR